MKRRQFLQSAAAAAVGAISFPTLIPSRAFARFRPNNKINVAQIGCGRIARSQDMPGVIRFDSCRFVAVSDFDIHRARDAKKWVEDYYAEKTGKKDYVDVKVYQDYREIINDPSIDAVIISTPDHWHAQPAMEAALAGKDVYLQKPASLTIVEGRQMADAVHRTGCILQIGSQQRSLTEPQFHKICELVRNGAVGEIKTIKVGLPGDPAGKDEPEMPVPENLNYDAWLGSTPVVYYTENRVHPQKGFGRPGWLRCEQFGAGMITGWGAHHVDIAHWGMGTEFTGPVEVEGSAEFPKSGLWDVHGDFHIEAKYANGIRMEIDRKHRNGVRFEGSEGWVFVGRGNSKVTASDPTDPNDPSKAVEVSDPKILQYPLGPDAALLYRSPDHYQNWVDCIRSRQQPVAPAEVGHRSCSACLVSHIAMKLPRKLRWDPLKERFLDDDQANSMLSRPQRKPFGTNYVLG